jgi:hypothetical protein
MKANNTGETDINVVGKYFRLTFVFYGLKTSLKLCLSSPIALKLFLIFKIRGVLSLKTCLEGGNLVNKSCMHHNTSLDALSTTFIKTTCKGQAWVGSKHDFAGNSWWHVKQVEQGSMDMTQSKSIKWKDQ